MTEMELELDTCGSMTCNKIRAYLLYGIAALHR